MFWMYSKQYGFWNMVILVKFLNSKPVVHLTSTACRSRLVCHSSGFCVACDCLTGCSCWTRALPCFVQAKPACRQAMQLHLVLNTAHSDDAEDDDHDYDDSPEEEDVSEQERDDDDDDDDDEEEEEEVDD